MQRFLIVLWLGVFALTARAQVDTAEFLNRVKAREASAHFSTSRQFIVYDAPYTGEKPLLFSNQGGSHYVRIDAPSLTVSCERVKKSLLDYLGIRDQWEGRITIQLRHAGGLDEPIVVQPIAYGSVWAYQMTVPDVVDQTHAAAALVEVMLLELANRGSGRCAEIPPWLTQGLTAEMIYECGNELILEAAKQSPLGGNLFQVKSAVNVWWIQTNSQLSAAHQELESAPPLTIEELSWPKPGQTEGADGAAYRASAQLLLHELTSLPGGRECLRAFILNLSSHLNWQLTFLQAFHSHFPTQLQLDKWWALKLAGFTGRDISKAWPGDVSWRKLTQVVRPVVDVRTSSSEMPMRTEVSLQTIIAEWDFVRQNNLLQGCIGQLFLLRAGISQDLVYLTDDYRRVLANYLKQRQNTVNQSMGRQTTQGLDRLAADTIRQLDVLDARREQLRSQAESKRTLSLNDVSR